MARLPDGSAVGALPSALSKGSAVLQDADSAARSGLDQAKADASYAIKNAESWDSLVRSDALRREKEIELVAGQLNGLQTLALETDDEVARSGFIRTGQELIGGLEDTRLVDEAGGRAMREGWTRAYATERLGRLPPDKRIKLLERGTGTVAEFIPEDQRQELMRVAQVDATDAQRKAQSDAALAQYTLRQAIDDDLGTMQATGRGRDDLTPQQIDAALGSEARRAWQSQRDDARTIWTLTHDLSTLTEAEIDKRVASATPKGGETADNGDTPTVSTREQAIYDQVSARAAQLRELRRTDPAGSVADDPNVRVAAEEFDPQRPETAKALIDARLAAQERAGIVNKSALTLAEARDLLLPLARVVREVADKPDATDGALEQAQKQFVQRIEEIYGPESENILGEIAQRVTAQAGGFDADTATVGNGNAADEDIQSLIVPVAGGARGAAVLVGAILRGLGRLFGRKGNAPDETPPQSPYPNNTNDPSQLVRPRGPEQPSGSPLDGNGGIIAAGATAIEIQRRRMAAQDNPQRSELTPEQRDAFLADQPAQQELLRRTITEDFDQATSFVTDVAKTQGWTTSTESLLAIRHYTGRAYQRLNRMMREGTATPDQQKLTALITRGIESLPQNTQEIWRAPESNPERASKIWEKAEVGKEFDELGNQLQSFSRDRQALDEFLGESSLIVRIASPTKGAYIAPLSSYPGQSEVLLPAGLRYKVLSKKTESWGGKQVNLLELEIVR